MCQAFNSVFEIQKCSLEFLVHSNTLNIKQSDTWAALPDDSRI